MYERIVVGTDGSEHAANAVAHAAALAELTGAELHLVQGSGSPVVLSSLYGDVAAVDPHQVVRACAEALEPLAARLRAGGLAVEVHVVADSGHAALCDTAAQLAADLIVIGNRGMTGARRFLGSVPNSVAHHAPCSVLIVATG